MINTRLIYTSIIISGLGLISLILFPDLDVNFSRLFHDNEYGFIYRNNIIVVFLFLIIPIITKILFTIAVIHLFYQIIKVTINVKSKATKQPQAAKRHDEKLDDEVISQSIIHEIAKSTARPRNDGKFSRSSQLLSGLITTFWLRNLLMIIALSGSFYFILTTAISSGLIVNYVFKENFGRARPITIQDFGGAKNFSGPLVISDQCKHNCSFSSGHAAMGYSLTSLAYIFSYIYFTRIYSLVLIFGSLVGFSRILMGAHFLSDVIASCLVVLIINHLIYLWQKKLKAL